MSLKQASALRILPRSYVSRHQLAVLVKFMEEHPALFLGKITPEFSFETKKKLWKELVQLLNTEGQAHKTLRKWMRTWTDWKFGVKKKVVGGGIGSLTLLSDLEQRCAKLLETAALAADTQPLPPDNPPEEIFIKEEFEAEDPDDLELFPMMKDLESPSDQEIPATTNDPETSPDPEVLQRESTKGDHVKRPSQSPQGPPGPSKRRAPAGDPFDRVAAQQEATNERLDETNATLRDLNLAINNLSKTINNAASLLLSALGKVPH